MFYCGKSLDGFEYALNSYLLAEGYAAIDHLDAISLRCFGSISQGGPSTWFFPAVKPDAYLDRIRSLFGLRFCVLPARVCSLSREKWTLIGEIPRSLFEHSVRGIYYPHLPGFLLCRLESNERILIRDPIGSFAFTVDRDFFKGCLDCCDAFALFDLQGASEYSVLDHRLLVRQGVEHYASESNFLEFDFPGQYTDSPRERVALQYALTNHLVQLQKAYQYVMYAYNKSSAQIESLLAQYARTAINRNVKDIRSFEERFGVLLYEMGEGVYVGSDMVAR